MIKIFKNLLHSDKPHEDRPQNATSALEPVEFHREEDCPGCRTAVGLKLAELAEQRTITSREALPASGEMPAFLEEPFTHKRFPVTLPVCTVGRDSTNDLVVTGDESISRVHFVIFCEDGYFFVADGGSKNGTLINGNHITERSPLSDGDSICAGMLGLKFVVPNKERLIESAAKAAIHRTPKDTPLDSLELGDTIDSDLSEAQKLVIEQALAQAQKKKLEKEQQKQQTAAVKPKETKPAPELMAPQQSSAPDTVPQKPPAAASPAPSSVAQSSKQGEAPRSDCEFPGLAQLEQELAQLKEHLQDVQDSIRECEAKIEAVTSLKKSLLSEKGKALVDSCCSVFSSLGWEVLFSESDSQHLVLRLGDKLTGLVRVAWSESTEAELGKLIIAQAEHWAKWKSEPKAILLMQTSGHPYANAFSDETKAYASYKNVCLVSPSQLWSVYQELTYARSSGEELRNALLGAKGKLSGFAGE